MKSLTILCLLLVASSAVAADSFNTRMDRALNENRTEIAIIGMLKYCGKDGLAAPLYEKISDRIVSHSDTHIQTGQDSSEVVLVRVADAEARGVATGLRIAQLSPVEHRRICDSAVNMVNDVMAKNLKQGEP